MAEHVSSSQALVLIAAFGRVIDWLAAIDRPLPMSYVELWGLWVCGDVPVCLCEAKEVSASWGLGRCKMAALRIESEGLDRRTCQFLTFSYRTWMGR